MVREDQEGSERSYKPGARKKLDAYTWAITQLMAEKRKLNGNPVPCDGYSGRNSNKR